MRYLKKGILLIFTTYIRLNLLPNIMPSTSTHSPKDIDHWWRTGLAGAMIYIKPSKITANKDCTK